MMHANTIILKQKNMKHKILRLLLCSFMATAAMSSCSDSEYDFENLFPKEYHSIVAIADEESDSITFYDPTDNIDFSVNVIKGGSDPGIVAKAHLEPIPQDRLTAIDPGYVALPDSCYTLQGNSLTFDGEQAKQSIRVAFSMEKLYRFVTAYRQAGVTFVVGLGLVSENATVYSSKSRILRAVSYIEPGILTNAINPSVQ